MSNPTRQASLHETLPSLEHNTDSSSSSDEATCQQPIALHTRILFSFLDVLDSPVMHPQASQIMPADQVLPGDWNWAVEVAGGVGAQAVLASLLSVVGFMIIATLTRRLSESVKAFHLAMQLLNISVSRECLTFGDSWGWEAKSLNCGGC